MGRLISVLTRKAVGSSLRNSSLNTSGILSLMASQQVIAILTNAGGTATSVGNSYSNCVICSFLRAIDISHFYQLTSLLIR